MAAEQPTTANEYILHHLTFLSNKEPKGILDFSVIHLDSVFFSVLLAVLFAGSFYLAARKATAGQPGKFQNFVELLVEFVDTQVKDSFHGTNKLLAPLALTIFCWVLLFNAIGFPPAVLLKLGTVVTVLTTVLSGVGYVIEYARRARRAPA